jgi:hypothetical protein
MPDHGFRSPRDVCGLTEERVCAGWITVHDALNGGRDQQKSVHDAFDLPRRQGCAEPSRTIRKRERSTPVMVGEPSFNIAILI